MRKAFLQHQTTTQAFAGCVGVYWFVIPRYVWLYVFVKRILTTIIVALLTPTTTAFFSLPVKMLELLWNRQH